MSLRQRIETTTTGEGTRQPLPNELSLSFEGFAPKHVVMEKILEPTEQDVLCGRGGGTLRHPGNQRYRSLIKLNKPIYMISTKEQKSVISRSIVDIIRNNGGRFLERTRDDVWYDIGDAKATEKTSQALREGQSKLRKKLINRAVNRDTPNNNFHPRSFDATFSKNRCDPVPQAWSGVHHAMMHPPPVMRQSLDSLAKSEIELQHRIDNDGAFHSFESGSQSLRRDRPSSHYHHRKEVNREPCDPNNGFAPLFIELDPTGPQSIATATPPFSPKHTRQPNDQAIDKFDQSSLPKGERTQPKETPIIDLANDDIDDDQSIMTFDLDNDESFDDKEDNIAESVLRSAATASPVTSHLLALNNLKTADELRTVTFDSDCVQRQQQHPNQNQPQHSNYASDQNAEFRIFPRNSSRENPHDVDHENEDSSYISLGMLAPMFRREANYGSIRHAIPNMEKKP